LDFEQITGTVLSSTPVEGNQWSFVDIDNDQDFDAYITNWGIPSGGGTNIGQENGLFLNNAGTYTPITDDPISTTPSLTSTVIWGDFDNDADLDAITPSDAGYIVHYYQNDGNGNFTIINAGELGTTDKNQSGGSAGDYDNDGDLDLFIPGPGADNSFFRNDLSNGNNWVKFKLIGTASNKTGIGAKIWVSSNSIVQMRELLGSSTFFGTNSLLQHFGLGASNNIDNITVEWPSGLRETFSNVNINDINELTEGTGTLSINELNQTDFGVYPNPVKNDLFISFTAIKIQNKLEFNLYDLN
jgi:hypothetical protein